MRDRPALHRQISVMPLLPALLWTTVACQVTPTKGQIVCSISRRLHRTCVLLPCLEKPNIDSRASISPNASIMEQMFHMRETATNL